MNFFMPPLQSLRYSGFIWGRVYNEQISWSPRKILPPKMKKVIGFDPIAFFFHQKRGVAIFSHQKRGGCNFFLPKRHIFLYQFVKFSPAENPWTPQIRLFPWCPLRDLSNNMA